MILKEKNMNKSPSLAKNLAIIGSALLIAIVVILLPLSDDFRTIGDATLTAQGQTAVAILIFALILWITEAIPFHITGLLSMVLLTLFRIDTFKNIVRFGFGNDVIVFFIGVLILSSFITRSGLGKRISMFILSLTGNRTSNIIIGFLCAGVVLSMWITDMAVAAMLMPLAKNILEEEGVRPLQSNFGKALMISTAWGPIIGGIGTPAGCGANPLAVSFLKEMAGIDVSFVDWMIYGVPSAIFLIFPSWFILMRFFKPEMSHLKKTKEELQMAYKNLPKMDHEEKVTVTLFLTTVALWLLSPLLEQWLGINIPISMPVILTGCLFFFPGMTSIRWKEIERDMSWSSIVLVVSGVSLGMMLFHSGAALWVSTALLGGIGSIPILVRIFAIVLIVSLLKIIFSSNTVTGTIIIPIMIALAISLGLDPLGVTMPAAITASLAFILVTSTPTNVIPYSAGYFSIKDMAKAGVVLTIISSTILAVTLFAAGKLTGLY
jgi:sodium-dependent dicarboxylate transporter 2/3/5